MSKRHIQREEIVPTGTELSPLLTTNLSKLLDALNKFRNIYGKPMVVSSGYRTPEHNAAVGGKPNSAHMTCEACDFRDPDGILKAHCLANLHILEECSLYMESPEATPQWLHLTIRRPASGQRVFKP